jgi:hypothetical protein
VGVVIRPARVIALARCGFSFVVDCFSSGDVSFRAPVFKVMAFLGFFGTIDEISLKYASGFSGIDRMCHYSNTKEQSSNS